MRGVTCTLLLCGVAPGSGLALPPRVGRALRASAHESDVVDASGWDEADWAAAEAAESAAFFDGDGGGDDDDGLWARAAPVQASAGAETLLVGVARRGEDGGMGVNASLAELGSLAASAGLRVVGPAKAFAAGSIDARTYVDGAAIEAIRADLRRRAAGGGANFAVLFDDGLAPEQQRALEERLQIEAIDDLLPRQRRPNKKARAMAAQNARIAGDASRAEANANSRAARRRGGATLATVRVLDRTALVLEIFAKRATTRSGRLQVALAETLYATPRLSALTRRVDDDAAAGGSFGSNPTERRRTMEIDQKTLRDRAARLRRKIAALRAHRTRTRRRRRRNGLPTVALVGYTNSGKSSLLKALCGGSGAFAIDAAPFATLDPLTRRVEIGAGDPALVTDTVGFVSKLPAEVVAAFRATLEEVEDADVVVHVIDASAKDLVVARGRVVDAELRALNAADAPRVLFYNKVDAADDAAGLAAVAAARPDVVVGSAATGAGLGELKAALAAALAERLVAVDVALPFDAGHLAAEIKTRGVVASEEHTAAATVVLARVPRDLAGRLAPYARGPAADGVK